MRRLQYKQRRMECESGYVSGYTVGCGASVRGAQESERVAVCGTTRTIDRKRGREKERGEGSKGGDGMVEERRQADSKTNRTAVGIRFQFSWHPLGGTHRMRNLASRRDAHREPSLVKIIYQVRVRSRWACAVVVAWLGRTEWVVTILRWHPS